MPSPRQPTDVSPRMTQDRRWGANLRRIRTARGVTQAALAEEMAARGLTWWRQTTVSRVEQGVQPLRVDEMAALEAVLGRGLWDEPRSAQAGEAARLQAQIRSGLDRLRAEITEMEGLLQELAGVAGRVGPALDPVLDARPAVPDVPPDPVVDPADVDPQDRYEGVPSGQHQSTP